MDNIRGWCIKKSHQIQTSNCGLQFWHERRSRIIFKDPRESTIYLDWTLIIDGDQPVSEKKAATSHRAWMCRLLFSESVRLLFSDQSGCNIICLQSFIQKPTFVVSHDTTNGLGGLGFQFFLEMTCLGVIYHIQKDSWSLDAQNPPKKFLTFETFVRQSGVWPDS